MSLQKSNILITGGTGSFGSYFVNFLLKNYNFKKIIIYSRDELKQYELKQKLINNKKFKSLRFFIGDIRDKDRLNFALRNVQYVIHAAALKIVDSAEYNPWEYIKTNVIGSQNLVEECINNNVKKLVALSTDKACSPINLYGATKLCGDKNFLAANSFYGKSTFSIVRYGNVNGSRGSVIPFFIKQSENGIFTITDKKMTRFSIDLEQSSKLVMWTLQNSFGNEIVIPKMKSYKILDLARAVNKECKIKFIGKRPGEKIHEEIISEFDDRCKILLDDKYLLINKKDLKKYRKLTKKYNGEILNENFGFNSKDNDYLNMKELKDIIKKS